MKKHKYTALVDGQEVVMRKATHRTYTHGVVYKGASGTWYPAACCGSRVLAEKAASASRLMGEHRVVEVVAS